MSQKTEKQQTVYECESCGATSNTPKECCGKPMKKKAVSFDDCGCN